MFLPTTHLAALLLMLAAMLLWGSWINTHRAARPWRFELYYVDFAIGAVLAAVASAFTLGILNGNEITFQDNFLLTGYRKMAYAIGAGVLLNAGTIFLLAASSVAGLSVPMLIAAGVALLVTATGASVLPKFFLVGLGTPVAPTATYLALGLILLVLAILAGATSAILDPKHGEGGAAAPAAAQQARSRSGRQSKDLGQAGAATAVAFSVIAGVLFGLAYPVLQDARSGDNSVSPYGTILMMAIGVGISTVPIIGMFMFVPVRGESVGPAAYIKGTFGQHLLGWAGGMLWTAALLTALLGMSVTGAQGLSQALRIALWQGGALIGVLWGLTAWKDLAGAPSRSRLLLLGSALLFAVAVTVFAIAPAKV